MTVQKHTCLKICPSADSPARAGRCQMLVLFKNSNLYRGHKHGQESRKYMFQLYMGQNWTVDGPQEGKNFNPVCVCSFCTNSKVKILLVSDSTYMCFCFFNTNRHYAIFRKSNAPITSNWLYLLGHRSIGFS